MLASFGHTVQAETEHGHVFRFGTHLVAGWAWRGDRARLVHEGYGIDREHAESVHGFAGGTISSVGLLFDGVAGPVFEASWLTGPVRGLAHWHMGVGVAVTLGRGVEQFPDRSRLARQ